MQLHTTPILFPLILISAFGAVLLITVAGFWLGAGPTGNWLRTREDAARRMLDELFIQDLTARQVMIYVVLAAAVALFLAWVSTDSWLVACAVAIGTLFAPGMIFAHMREARRQRFDEQLPSALDEMASSAKAGLSLAQAIEEVTRNASPPVSQEFGLITKEYQLGTDLGTAIQTARTRLDSRNFSLVATALMVNREKGGNLPEALMVLSNSLKEIWRLEQKLITASAEGRKGIRVIAAMPLFLFAVVAFMQPDIIESLTSSLIGIVILGVAVGLYILAFFWLRQILKIDV